MSTIEQIKAEIEKRIRSIENCPFIEAEFGTSEKRDGKLIAYKDLLSFLSTLESEKPMNQDDAVKYKNLVVNSLRKKRVFPTLKGEQLHKFKNEVNTLKQILQPWQTYGNIQSELFEQFALAFAVWGSYNLNFQVQDSELEDSRDLQNQEGLNQEIIKYWQEWVSPSNKQSVEGVLPLSEFAFYARHFAQWGAEHLKK